MKRGSPAPLLRLLVLLLALLLASAPLAAGAAEPSAPKAAGPPLAIPFLEGRPFAEVLSRAKAEKKPILVDMYATWCGPCKMLDRTTFADADVGAWAKKRVVAAKIDAEKGEGRRLSRRYAVTSFPTILFLDSSGNEIDRMMGAFPPEAFRTNGEAILAGESELSRAIAKTKETWDAEEGIKLVGALLQRNDLARARPIVLELVRRDSELQHPETLEALFVLGSMEDYSGKLSPETGDMLASFLTRIGDDPRRGAIAVALAKEAARNGDLAEAKRVVDTTMKALGETNAYAPDLRAALASAQAKAGRGAAAVVSFQKALALPAASSKSGSWMAEQKLGLAGALAAAGRREEAASKLKEAVASAGSDPALLARAARLSLVLKDTIGALALAKKAIDATRGEDAAAQAALGASLAASGDGKGASAAYARAVELDPDDRELRKELAAVRKKG